MLGLALYLVKFLHSPISFTFYDSLLNLRTVGDILRTGHLFEENPLLQVSPFFPGLGIVTTAIVSLTGLSTYIAGTLVIGAARLVLILGLYLFYEQVGGSAWVAGVGSLLYAANPNFVFFDAQYSYESLALAFLILVLFATLRRERMHPVAGVALTSIAILVSGALVITHHITSYALVAFLALWTMTGLLRALASVVIRAVCRTRVGWHIDTGTRGEQSLDPSGMALIVLVLCLSWVLYVASFTITYIARPLASVASELLQLILRESNMRQMFQDPAGQSPPLWEQLTGYLSVGLTLLGLPFALAQVWRRYRTNVLAIALAIAAAIYPLSLTLRLTQYVATATRTTEFLFIAIAFVLSAWALELRHRYGSDWGVTGVLTAWITIIFLGGVILGWAPWGRLPGPYLVVADTRSIEAQDLSAAQWIGSSLGPGNRIAADRINAVLMASYGEQRPVTLVYDHVNVPFIFFSTLFDRDVQSIIKQGQIRYVVVDKRLSSGLPRNGFYFEAGEMDAYKHKTPPTAEALSKLEGVNGVSRIFDSGDIQIYDVGVFLGDP